MKVLLRFLFMVALVVYLLVSFFVLRSHAAEDKCGDVQVVMRDSGHFNYITISDILGYIDEYDLNPTGKPMSEVDTEKIERLLMQDGTLASVECYKRVGGTVCIEIAQRIPVMRVKDNYGGDYYVDAEGKRMSPRTVYPGRLPLVTGYVDSVLTYRDVLPMTQYIYAHRFWNAQIEQIYVNENHEIELTPRVGGQTILMGRVDDYEGKFDNLMQIYRQVFSHTGWSRYDTVSLKFKGQVICSRRRN